MVGYQYVILDLDDTLLDFKKGETDGLSRVLKNHGVADDELPHVVSIYHQVNRTVWTEIEQGSDRKVLLNQRFTRLFKQLGRPVDDLLGLQIESDYRAYLNNNFAVIEGSKQLLERLSAKNLTLIAGTNGSQETQENRLKHTQLGQYFDSVFISEAVGYAKPSEKFYQPIFKHYPKMDHNNAIMIGDSLNSDIAGAHNSAIDSIWFNPSGMENTSLVKPKFVAKTYNDILSILV